MFNRYSNMFIFFNYIKFIGEADCQNLSAPGQLGVAITRVMSASDVRVINFNANAYIPSSVKRKITFVVARGNLHRCFFLKIYMYGYKDVFFNSLIYHKRND